MGLCDSKASSADSSSQNATSPTRPNVGLGSIDVRIAVASPMRADRNPGIAPGLGVRRTSDSAVVALTSARCTEVIIATSGGHDTPRESAVHADEEREAPPPPEAVDLLQAGLTHPAQLRLDVDELILGIVLGAADRGPERGVELRRRRRDHLEVREHTARPQLPRDLAEQLPLAVVAEVMDRKPRDDHVELAERADVEP